MEREKLLIKIEQTKEKLYKYKNALDKITPHKPIDSDGEYYCWYCGEQVRKGTKKHKCGYLIDWSEK